MVEGSKLRKLWQAVKVYIKFLKLLPEYPIVHVNVASDSSYYRKSLFIKAAKRAGRKIVIHQHGGDFETFYEKEQNDRGRARIRQVLGMGDVFLVLSPALEQFLKEYWNLPRSFCFPMQYRFLPISKRNMENRKFCSWEDFARKKAYGNCFLFCRSYMSSFHRCVYF